MKNVFLIATIIFLISIVFSCSDSKDYTGNKVLEWHDSLETNPKKVFFYYSKNDLNNGLIKQYRKDSSLKYEMPIKDGVEHGLVKVYFSNDSLNYKANYKNGLMDGPIESYNSKGTLKFIGNYMEGKKNGEWNYYSKDGLVTKTEVYRNDTLISNNEEN